MTLTSVCPARSTITPDVVFTQSGFVVIELETTNVPVGTQIRVRVTKGSEVIERMSTPVVIANGTAGTAQADIGLVPAGVGTIQAFAEFTAQ